MVATAVAVVDTAGAVEGMVEVEDMVEAAVAVAVAVATEPHPEQQPMCQPDLGALPRPTTSIATPLDTAAARGTLTSATETRLLHLPGVAWSTQLHANACPESSPSF